VNDLFKLPLAVVFHPAETFRQVKRYREGFTYLPVLVLFVAVVAVRTIFIFLVHFPLATVQPRDANILLEAVKFIVPLVTWAVSSFAVSSIMGGEAHFKEILMASAYAFMPYILLSIPIAAVSRVLSAAGGEQNLFGLLTGFVWAWVIMLLVVGVKILHDYHIWMAILVCFLSILGIALIWSLFVLVYALTGNLRAFLQGLILEIWMTFRYG
jgi:hypothetical protein